MKVAKKQTSQPSWSWAILQIWGFTYIFLLWSLCICFVSQGNHRISCKSLKMTCRQMQHFAVAC